MTSHLIGSAPEESPTTSGSTITTSTADNDVPSRTDQEQIHNYDDLKDKSTELNPKNKKKNDDDNWGAPLVTIHDILPRKIVSTIVKELKSSTRIVQHPDGQLEHQCILRRDGLVCGNERWIELNVSTLLDDSSSSSTSK